MIHKTNFYNTSSDFVYLELRGRIVDKKYKPGQRLPEVKIAMEMGVSRTPVREALRRLAEQGLVRVVPNSGARVVAPTSSEVDAAYAVREYLEAMSVRLACMNGIDGRMADRLEEVIAEEEASFQARDIETNLKLNDSFHRLIAEAGKNVVLCEYIENIVQRTNVYILFYDPFSEETNYSVSDHRNILRAISERDVDAAENLMREHLLRSRSVLYGPEDEPHTERLGRGVTKFDITKG